MAPIPCQGDSSSSLSVSSSDGDEEPEVTKPIVQLKKTNSSKKAGLSYNELTKHGYSSGLSVLNVPAPRQTGSGDQNWSWSAGKRKNNEDDAEEPESFEERERTRQAANAGAEKLASDILNEHSISKRQRRDAAAEHRALSFSKKEKRKRDLGQTSRGKSYVEEEKRLLRGHHVYSGFD